MDLISFNFMWMSFNIFLAIIPVFAGWMFYFVNKKFLKIILVILWILFVPNSIYLFTDIVNLIYQWGLGGTADKVVFIFQYSVLFLIGLLTYILSIYPFDLYLNENLNKSIKFHKIKIIILFNFIIGFGITLGRVERINSWEAITNPIEVLKSSLTIMYSFDLILLTVLFGIFANLIYFTFKSMVIRCINTYFQLFDDKLL